ncbi:MAG: hypothetical protein K6U11_00645 [bacterium]|nr:hypothetical protein [bacterium]
MRKKSPVYHLTVSLPPPLNYFLVLFSAMALAWMLMAAACQQPTLAAAPPARIRALNSQGGQKGQPSAPGKSADTDIDIRDIKPPLEMKINWIPSPGVLLWGAVGLALILLTVFLGIIAFRKKKTSPKSKPKSESIPLLPAHEVALAELKKLWDDFSQNSQSEEKIKELYIRISEIIRIYLAGRYKISALEATTEELLDELSKLSLHVQDRMLISDFLTRCDLVKFARHRPQMTETEQSYQMAVEIIDRTRPVIENSKIPADNAGKEMAEGPYVHHRPR